MYYGYPPSHVERRFALIAVWRPRKKVPRKGGKLSSAISMWTR